MSLRFERANSEIKRCLSDIIQTRMNNPHLNPMLYVSEVDISKDFKYCKVKIALDSEDEKELEKIFRFCKMLKDLSRENLQIL